MSTIRDVWESYVPTVARWRSLIRWRLDRRPFPPPHAVKQRTVRRYAKKGNFTTLVETGTYHGSMVAAMLPYFDSIVSIELSEELFRENLSRFSGRSAVTLVQGDSASVLCGIVDAQSQPALFWLDGHYSAGETARGLQDTPILDELLAVSRSRIFGHAILIDDARLFGSDPEYPTPSELKEFAARHFPGHHLSMKDDIIRILPVGIT